MDVDVNTDSGSVMDEAGWGGGPICIDTNRDFTHLSKRERAKAKARAIERQQKWKKALAVRENWTPEQFTAEEMRLAQEVAEHVARQAA